MNAEGKRKRFLQIIPNVIFPPLCLHCEEKMPSNEHSLCIKCLEELCFLKAEQRCVHCFCENEKGYCDACRAKPAPYKRCAAVFEYLSPASAFVKALKYQRRDQFAKTLAAFMVVQLEKLCWPTFDCIVPVPQTLLRRFERGFNQSFLIAKQMGQMLNVETLDVLKRKMGGFSQNLLPAVEREALSQELFSCKPVDLTDKTILLVDDVMTTSTTLRRSATALQSAFPKAIYSLSFCFAEK